MPLGLILRATIKIVWCMHTDSNHSCQFICYVLNNQFYHQIKGYMTDIRLLFCIYARKPLP